MTALPQTRKILNLTMASPQDSRVVYEMGFALLNLVDVPVGRMTIKLYPKSTPAMHHECAHAFQVNKATLKDLLADMRLVIDAFGAQLNASWTVEGILSNCRRYFNERWMDFAHLVIHSFHNLQGNQIGDTTTAGDSQVLLPVQDGDKTTSRKQDVRFVCMQCMLDFGTLFTAHPYPVNPFF